MLKNALRVAGKSLELLTAGLLVLAVLLFWMPRLFQIIPYTVLSGSMEPVIRTGSLCYIDRTAVFDEVKDGDIIAFARMDGSCVLHRAIRTEAGKLRTKGDANGAEDLAAVSRENFLGKEVCCIPYLGYVTVFLQKKEGKAAAVMAAAVFFLAGLFVQVCRKEGKEYEKT